MINKILNVFRREGVEGIWRAIKWRVNIDIVWRLKPKGPRRLAVNRLAGCKGIEIGGPSSFFGATGPIPIYPVIGTLDNCNFSTSTVWQAEIIAGESTYRYADGRTAGKQYICEAADLRNIPSSTYDFLICSHVIEHVANPLAALREWLRIIRTGGTMLLVVPHRDGAFDHRRPVTTFQHLVEDFEGGTKEDDLTHLPEILALHDLSRDPYAGTHAQFEARSRKNSENRCLHHHVFDVEVVGKMLTHAECEILALDQLAPHHIIAVARKSL